ncbi:MAG: hypothetical protein ACKO2V_19070, partial [Snowella sp.]
MYIGDRATGKTHLALELANPNYNYVKVTYPTYDELRVFFYTENLRDIKPTGSIAPEGIYDRYLEIEVKLATGIKLLKLDWLDTPGEIWRKGWQKINQNQWKNFLETIQ